MFIGLAVDRWRGDAQLQAVAVHTGESILGGARLDVQFEHEVVAIAATGSAHISSRCSGGNRIISSSLSPITTRIGDRSSPEIGGSRRRAGFSKGAVN